jgi:PAS domain S-box-containing protein
MNTPGDPQVEDRPRILIVDDDPEARALLEALLYREGYKLAFAANGPEALAAVNEFGPDAIILDVMMPGMDGFEVCRRLRADPIRGEVPVLFVTALDDRDSRLRGIESGADDFITKPIDRVELRTRVKTITRLNRYRQLLWERTRRLEAEEEILRRNRELSLLNHVITAAASTFDNWEILCEACQAFVNTFGLSCAIATLLDKEHERFELALSYKPWQRHGICEATACLPIMGPDRQLSEPRAIADARNAPELAPVQDHIRERGIASILFVPILVGDKLAGGFELTTDQRREFSNHDLTLAQSVSAAIGQALDRNRLYRELEQHAEALEETVVQRTWELSVERDRTQAILEALGEAVLVADVDGTIRYANPAAANLTGYSTMELRGRSWNLAEDAALSRLSKDHVGKDDRPPGDLPDSEQMWSGEAVYFRKDGTPYEAAVTIAPMFDPMAQDKLAGFVSVQRDITPLKEAERLKDQFISNVSHELRTPLSVITLISGNLHNLYDRLETDKRRRMVQDLREHIRILNQVIDDVLEISRIDSQRISMEQEQVNLMQLAWDEADKQLPLAQSKRQTLRVIGVQELPVCGNEGQLRQVIRNLLNNAIKYTPEGGQITCEGRILSDSEVPIHGDAVKAPVENHSKHGNWVRHPWETSISAPLAPRQPGKWAELRVVDTGPGISQEDIPHLFERFFRVKSQGTVPGTGLGLSIARELVDLNGGSLTATSTLGEGSTFILVLPLMEESTQ